MFIKSFFRLILILGVAAGCTRSTGKPEGSTEPFTFDVKQTSFSCPKSAFSVGNTVRTKGLVLTDIRFSQFAKKNIIFRFLTVSGSDTVVPEAIGTPGELSLLVNDRVIGKACFESPEKFRLTGQNSSMILLLDSIIIAENRLEIEKINDHTYKLINKNNYGTSRHVLSCLEGSLNYSGSRGLFTLTPGNDKSFAICVEETDSTWKTEGPEMPFEECVSSNQEDFNAWLSSMPSLPEKYNDSRKLAAYVLWSCIMGEGGHLERPGILMSKNWMHYIWSWDHCFNAMACSYKLPEFAWDNFMVMFDAQDKEGQIPGRVGYSITADSYVKPPVHGWALKKLMNETELNVSQKEQAYTGLKAWTNFWFTHKDSNHNGIPEYNHGYDSGWDNGTEFDLNGKTKQWGHWESANLSAYLILQMDVLQELASELGYADEARHWQQKSDSTLSLMISECWNGEKFVTRNLDNNSINRESRSLMAFLPVVLGKKLPEEIRSKLIHDLKSEGYLTEWGLATENINSSLYVDESYAYWRGPIWAPSTMIIVDGLNKCGEHEFATEIAERYCDLCAKSGFAENFNAKTGKGLRDLAYTWTASVFLVLGHEYLD